VLQIDRELRARSVADHAGFAERVRIGEEMRGLRLGYMTSAAG
jgi:hypothetical protein